MENTNASISFYGGTGVVTGANFLLSIAGKKILVDCGLVQGVAFAGSENRKDFQYDPHSVDMLFVTHAHMDHIGRIPKLVRDGFDGPIYSTLPTKEIASVMLEDALSILELEARRDGVLPMYEKQDIEKALSLWKDIPYYTDTSIADGLSVNFKDSGHILGSAMITFIYNGKQIVFTGDLGNSPALFLKDTDSIKGASYVVMESVYGDRNHESKESRKEAFRAIVKDTMTRKRTLIIPAFSLERTQDILFELNDFVTEDQHISIPVFLDSPLASKVTEIYQRHTNLFKESARELVASGDDLFSFKHLSVINTTRESHALDKHSNPKIIIAGSGMSHGGRVVSHEEYYLPDKDATILLVGYQVPGSLGRQLEEGAKKVKIHGQNVKVRAEIKKISGYSSHKDSDHLLAFIEDTKDTVKKVFVAMGEPSSSMFLAQRMRDYLGVDAISPQEGDTIEISL